MNKNYAPLFDRVKAAFIDAIVLIGAMYAISEIFALFEEVPNALRIIASVIIFILYDPFFTSFYGGTIGHSYAKIGVRSDEETEKNIPFLKALIRFLLKATLGWISLLTTTGNEKRKAIHDFAVNSIVVEINRD